MYSFWDSKKELEAVFLKKVRTSLMVCRRVRNFLQKFQFEIDSSRTLYRLAGNRKTGRNF